MVTAFRRRWFLLALAGVLTLGIRFPEPFSWVGQTWQLRYAVVAGVLFLMALPLNPSAVTTTLSKPVAPILGILINLGLLPAVAWLIAPVLNDEMGPGFLVAAATPSTLASAAVWTRRAGGNDAICVVVTIATNLACFLITPLWLAAMSGGHISGRISPSDLATKLVLIVVLPMAAAQLLRLYRPVATWSNHHKNSISSYTQLGILAMVFIGAVRTGRKLLDAGESLADGAGFWIMLAAVVGLHLAMFVAGFIGGRALRLNRADRIAVGFSGSQKTLMVGLQVAVEYNLSILPMVSYHVSQLLVDTLIADRLAQRGRSTPATPELNRSE